MTWGPAPATSILQRVVLAASLATACGCTPVGQDDEVASLSDLIARPAAYSAQSVELSGFMNVSWDGGGLFRTPTEASSHDTEHAVMLRIPTKTLGPLEQYDGTFGTITGVFESDQSLGWTGTLTVRQIRPSYRFRQVNLPRRASPGTDAERRLREEVFRILADQRLEDGSKRPAGAEP
ncbi:MAG: hypothetical protein ACE37F_32415 [Nannocystaceae bacterium]